MAYQFLAIARISDGYRIGENAAEALHRFRFEVLIGLLPGLPEWQQAVPSVAEDYAGAGDLLDQIVLRWKETWMAMDPAEAPPPNHLLFRSVTMRHVLQQFGRSGSAAPADDEQQQQQPFADTRTVAVWTEHPHCHQCFGPRPERKLVTLDECLHVFCQDWIAANLMYDSALGPLGFCCALCEQLCASRQQVLGKVQPPSQGAPPARCVPDRPPHVSISKPDVQTRGPEAFTSVSWQLCPWKAAGAAV
jgi:hypothetical protein